MDNKGIWITENLQYLRNAAGANRDKKGYLKVTVNDLIPNYEFIEGEFDKSKFQDTGDEPVLPEGFKVTESFWGYYEIIFSDDILRFRDKILVIKPIK